MSWYRWEDHRYHQSYDNLDRGYYDWCRMSLQQRRNHSQGLMLQSLEGTWRTGDGRPRMWRARCFVCGYTSTEWVMQDAAWEAVVRHAGTKKHLENLKEWEVSSRGARKRKRAKK